MRAILFYVFLLYFCILVCAKEDNKSAENGHESAGIIICSGENHILLETLTLLNSMFHSFPFFRNYSASVLPITISHCNELSSESTSLFRKVFRVDVMNICSGPEAFTPQYHKKLQSFFCKPASLLVSPYRHTLLVDSDVHFLKNPLLLFESDVYKNSGSLFFRDRWTVTKNRLTLTKG